MGVVSQHSRREEYVEKSRKGRGLSRHILGFDLILTLQIPNEELAALPINETTIRPIHQIHKQWHTSSETFTEIELMSHPSHIHSIYFYRLPHSAALAKQPPCRSHYLYSCVIPPFPFSMSKASTQSLISFSTSKALTPPPKTQCSAQPLPTPTPPPFPQPQPRPSSSLSSTTSP